MPTYAVLGGTGQTGSAIIRQALSQDITLRVYARSAKRVQSTIPELSTAKNVSLHIGDINDTALMTECLRGVDTVFMTAASNYNDPKITIARDAARAIINALISLREEVGKAEFKCPTIIFLSSNSLSPTLSANNPAIIQWLVHQSNYYVYHDIEQAILLIKDQHFIPLVEVCPGALTLGKPTGFQVQTTPATEAMLSYEDLAGGMLKIAKGGEKWQGKEVAVAGMGKVEGANVLVLAKYLSRGFLVSWVPGFAKIGDWSGLW